MEAPGCDEQREGTVLTASMSMRFSGEPSGSGSRAAEIFICHPARSEDAAVALRAALGDLGARPWARAVDLLPGDTWDTVLVESLARAPLVAVIIDGHWTNVDWATLETLARAIDKAESGRLRLVPILVGALAPEGLPFGLMRIEPLRVDRSEWRDVARRLVALLGDGRDVGVWLDALDALLGAGLISPDDRERVTRYAGGRCTPSAREDLCRHLALPDPRLRWWPTRVAMAALRVDEPLIARRQRIIAALRLGLPLEHRIGELRFVLIPPGRTASGESGEPVYLAERPLDAPTLARLWHALGGAAHRRSRAADETRGRRRAARPEGLSFDEVIDALEDPAAGGALGLPSPRMVKYAAETRLVEWADGMLSMCESEGEARRYMLLGRRPCERGGGLWATHDVPSTGARDARYRIQPVYRPGMCSP